MNIIITEMPVILNHEQTYNYLNTNKVRFSHLFSTGILKNRFLNQFTGAFSSYFLIYFLLTRVREERYLVKRGSFQSRWRVIISLSECRRILIVTDDNKAMVITDRNFQ